MEMPKKGNEEKPPGLSIRATQSLIANWTSNDDVVAIAEKRDSCLARTPVTTTSNTSNDGHTSRQEE